MATPRRLMLTNVPYHITSKVVNSEFWFNPEKRTKKYKRKKFKTVMSIKTFIKYKRVQIAAYINYLIAYMYKKYGFKITHFLLMDNHYHMIAEVTKSKYDIGRCMQTFNMSIAKWVNKRTGRTGAFFSKRYASNAILDEDYGKAVIGYIYANPVKANISIMPYEHDITSYTQYVFGKESSEIEVKENCRILKSICSSKKYYAETIKELVAGYMEDRLNLKKIEFKRMLRHQVLTTSKSFKGLSKRKQNYIRKITGLGAEKLEEAEAGIVA